MKSIYELIKDSVKEDGTIGKDFKFPYTDDEKNKIKMADGALDGIFIYHSVNKTKEKEIDELCKIVENECNNIKNINMESFEKFFEKHSAIGVIDNVLERILKKELLIAEDADILKLGYYLASKSCDKEVVKLGIAFIGIFNVENYTEIKDLVITLGLNDEFTLYSIVAVGTWSNSNDIIFDYAKKLKGWGKIHAVERLEPETDEIKSWIIKHGCENEILNSYLGLICAQKGELINLLKNENINNEEFRGCGIILTAMLDEEPVLGISIYEYSEEALLLYVSKLERMCVNVYDLYNVILIKDWLNELDEDGKSQYNCNILSEQCDMILQQEAWKNELIKEIDNDNLNISQLIFIASKLNIDIYENIFKFICKNPLKSEIALKYVFDKDEYFEKLIEIYEKVIPFSKLATGMGDEPFFGDKTKENMCIIIIISRLAEYPCKNENLVKYTLNMPIVNCRRTAVSTIEQWLKITNKDLSEISPLLYNELINIIPKEINEELKDKMLLINK